MYAVRLGPVFWLLIAGTFPLVWRSRASSMAAIANWSLNLLVTLTPPELIDPCGCAGKFLMYAVPIAAVIAFTVLLESETKGCSLEGVEDAPEAWFVLISSAAEGA